MNTLTRHHSSRRYICMACFVFLFGMASASVAQQTPSEAAGVQQAPVEIRKSTDTFEYQIEGRPDPFMPFITERSSSTENPDEIIEGNQNLTGMQLFEPGQLTLVALLQTGGSTFAMVQDFTGKGYVIEEGTKIGRRGVVSDIVTNKVIIEEKALTRGGKTLTNKIAMVLKKEGEE